jgi:hypothetical protein
VPFYQQSCDHLEEQMFPVETWGSQYVVSSPAHPGGTGVAPLLYRIVANTAATSITFTPASINGPVTLGAGEFMELTTDQDFLITAGSPIGVYTFMHGVESLGLALVVDGPGDPAMGTAIPQAPVRNNYAFLTPETYTSNYVNVVRGAGAEILLDGIAVTGFTPIDTGSFEVARVPVNAGPHSIHSPGGQKFSITAYGYAAYTSYYYPGGMNLIK